MNTTAATTHLLKSLATRFVTIRTGFTDNFTKSVTIQTSFTGYFTQMGFTKYTT